MGDIGRSPDGSGYSPSGLSRSMASQAEPSIPNATRIWLSPKQVAGTLAMWAIRQSPYPCPDNLAEVVDAFGALWPAPEPVGLSEWSSVDEIEDALKAVFVEIPALLDWNNRKNGNTAPFGFCSRYDKPHPDDDFIDLGALWSNVARSLWAEECAASGIETGTAKSEALSAEHESPTAESGDAQTQEFTPNGD